MTLRDLPAGLAAYDAELAARTGCTLRELACRAVGVSAPRFAKLARASRVAVVPMDSGQGVLPGFAEALAAIAGRLGLEAWVTRPDVAGLAEAYERGAGILVTADEERYIAVNLRTHAVADNNEATARGFVTALGLLAARSGAGEGRPPAPGGRGTGSGGAGGRGASGHGLAGRAVLVLGCGPVGRAAARCLLERGAAVCLHDSRPERAREAAAELAATGAPVLVEADLETALAGHALLFDATPSPGFITERHITPGTCVAAPGVPLGLSAGAVRAVGRRLVHDPLEIGTAVMLAEALAR